jgi:hypothetical protein
LQRTIKCAICARLFGAKSKKAKYCGKLCRYRAQMRGQAEKRKRDRLAGHQPTCPWTTASENDDELFQLSLKDSAGTLGPGEGERIEELVRERKEEVRRQRIESGQW